MLIGVRGLGRRHVVDRHALSRHRVLLLRHLLVHNLGNHRHELRLLLLHVEVPLVVRLLLLVHLIFGDILLLTTRTTLVAVIVAIVVAHVVVVVVVAHRLTLRVSTLIATLPGLRLMLLLHVHVWVVAHLRVGLSHG